MGKGKSKTKTLASTQRREQCSRGTTLFPPAGGALSGTALQRYPARITVGFRLTYSQCSLNTGFSSRLREDFLLRWLARLAPFPGSLTAAGSILVPIFAFLGQIMPQNAPPFKVLEEMATKPGEGDDFWYTTPHVKFITTMLVGRKQRGIATSHPIEVQKDKRPARRIAHERQTRRTSDHHRR
jgi:hypothetical protein